MGLGLQHLGFRANRRRGGLYFLGLFEIVGGILWEDAKLHDPVSLCWAEASGAETRECRSAACGVNAHTQQTVIGTELKIEFCEGLILEN